MLDTGRLPTPKMATAAVADPLALGANQDRMEPTSRTQSPTRGGAILAPPRQTMPPGHVLGQHAPAGPPADLPRSPSQWLDTDVPSSSLGDPFGRQPWIDGVTPRPSTDLSEPQTAMPSPVVGPTAGPGSGYRSGGGTSSPPPPAATNHPRSLASYIAAHPTRPVRKAISALYPRPPAFVRMFTRWGVRHSVINGLSDAELREWEEREGRARRREAGWRLAGEEDDGTDAAVVSPLFWKVRRGSEGYSGRDGADCSPAARCTPRSCRRSSATPCPASCPQPSSARRPPCPSPSSLSFPTS